MTNVVSDTAPGGPATHLCYACPKTHGVKSSDRDALRDSASAFRVSWHHVWGAGAGPHDAENMLLTTLLTCTTRRRGLQEYFSDVPGPRKCLWLVLGPVGATRGPPVGLHSGPDRGKEAIPRQGRRRPGGRDAGQILRPHRRHYRFAANRANKKRECCPRISPGSVDSQPETENRQRRTRSSLSTAP